MYPSPPPTVLNSNPDKNFYEDEDMMHYGMGATPRAAVNPARRNRRFDEYFRVYPIAAAVDQKEYHFGGKIVLPPSALEKLTRLHITYPMLFELRNGSKERTTHAGVLQFTAEEGRAYLPYWVRPPPLHPHASN